MKSRSRSWLVQSREAQESTRDWRWLLRGPAPFPCLSFYVLKEGGESGTKFPGEATFGPSVLLGMYTCHFGAVPEDESGVGVLLAWPWALYVSRVNPPPPHLGGVHRAQLRAGPQGGAHGAIARCIRRMNEQMRSRPPGKPGCGPEPGCPRKPAIPAGCPSPEATFLEESGVLLLRWHLWPSGLKLTGICRQGPSLQPPCSHTPAQETGP